MKRKTIMLNYTNFYITENDVELLRKVLKSVTTQKKLTNYDKQLLYRLTKDVNDAIIESGGNNG